MQNDDCLFCKISRGEIPSKKIYEDVKFLPSTTLILPRLCISLSFPSATLRLSLKFLPKTVNFWVKC